MTAAYQGFCLIGAVDRLRCDDLTLQYLMRVTRTRHERCPFGHPVIGEMNDHCIDFEELRGLSRGGSGTGDRRPMEIDAFACMTRILPLATAAAWHRVPSCSLKLDRVMGEQNRNIHRRDVEFWWRTRIGDSWRDSRLSLGLLWRTLIIKESNTASTSLRHQAPTLTVWTTTVTVRLWPTCINSFCCMA